jgi:hypothetical protein
VKSAYDHRAPDKEATLDAQTRRREPPPRRSSLEAAPREWRKPCTILPKGHEPRPVRAHRHPAPPASLIIVSLWWTEQLRFTYDNRMTLAIYAHITDGMQDSATAALKETLLDPAVDVLLTKGSGSIAKAPSFSAICRTLRSGGTRIRTGDTMIFRLVRRSGASRDETAWAATQAVSSPYGPQRTPPDAANRRYRCGTGVVSGAAHGQTPTLCLRKISSLSATILPQ